MQIAVADATISVEMSGITDSEGRDIYAMTIVTPEWKHSDHSIKSGCLGCDEWHGMASALSFLQACGDAANYEYRTGRGSENSDLFPAHVAIWAAQHVDELSIAAMELEAA
jgi:hypothetical protein